MSERSQPTPPPREKESAFVRPLDARMKACVCVVVCNEEDKQALREEKSQEIKQIFVDELQIGRSKYVDEISIRRCQSNFL